MAAPNIIAASRVVGRTAANAAVNTQSSGQTNVLITNPPNSNAVFKINTLTIGNRTSSSSTVSVIFSSGANLTGTNSFLVSNVTVPGNSTLSVIDSTNRIYLEEDDSIGVYTGGSAGSISAIASFEEIYA